MKQIVVISGKGGTGKTTVTAALASLIENKVVVDCDVDASDLHIIFNPEILREEPFYMGVKASIDKTKCVKCGKCIEVCRFGAIDDDYNINPMLCEGCAFCHTVCEYDAVSLNENLCGKYYISTTRFGDFIHAELGIAEENSGKLVSLIRNEARKLAEEKGLDYVLIDGSPGIGCPVLASLTGADMVLIVTEPTLSAFSDLKRIMELVKRFELKPYLILNKAGVNESIENKIFSYALKNGVMIAGKIKYSYEVVKAMLSGKTLVEYNGMSRESIEKIWAVLKDGS